MFVFKFGASLLHNYYFIYHGNLLKFSIKSHVSLIALYVVVETQGCVTPAILFISRQIRFVNVMLYRKSQKTLDLEGDLGTFNAHSTQNERPLI